MTDAENRQDMPIDGPDTYPLWTIRYTWAIHAADGEITYTFTAAASETEAIDRAVFALDRYDNSGGRALVAAHVRRADGWSEVPRSSVHLAQHAHLYAFQRASVRPS